MRHNLTCFFAAEHECPILFAMLSRMSVKRIVIILLYIINVLFHKSSRSIDTMASPGDKKSEETLDLTVKNAL